MARCQYTVTGWDEKLDLQYLSHCGSTYNFLSRSVPGIHSHVAGTLRKQASNQQPLAAHQCLNRTFPEIQFVCCLDAEKQKTKGQQNKTNLSTRVSVDGWHARTARDKLSRDCCLPLAHYDQAITRRPESACRQAVQFVTCYSPLWVG